MKNVMIIPAAFLFLILSAGCSEDDPSRPSPTALITDGPPVPRSEAVLTADRFARVKWTMTETNRRGITCGGYFVSDYPAGPRTGMGYKWSGWTAIDEFLAKIGEGYGTGTGGYVTYEDYSADCVVGTSCTGLVSRAWNLDHKYTLCYDDPAIEREFCEITTEIEGIDFGSYQTAGLRKGDAFINDTHIILFIYESRVRKPMIIDATGGGVSFRSIAWRFLADGGYRPIRYNNIVDDGAEPGTISDPIAIGEEALPMQVEGNTRNVVSMEIDYYSTAPAVSQRGPEVIYELALTASATLSVMINNLAIEGIGNDIHLLASLEIDERRMATGCIAAGDYSVAKELDPGIYYIVIDSGMDTPGEYTMNVSLE